MNIKTEKYKNESKKRLKKIIDKKFLTATIFPLAQFEDEFGHIWGHGKPEEALTPEELDFRDRWEDCRQRILNNGNQQRRNSLNEIDMYSVSWERYTTTFLPVDKYEKLTQEQKNGNRKS